jgi:hypothetical protein
VESRALKELKVVEGQETLSLETPSDGLAPQLSPSTWGVPEDVLDGF